MAESEKQPQPKSPEANPPQPTEKPETRYGSGNSLVKWLLIYIAVGLVVYGAWYYFAVAKNSSSSESSTGTSIY